MSTILIISSIILILSIIILIFGHILDNFEGKYFGWVGLVCSVLFGFGLLSSLMSVDSKQTSEKVDTSTYSITLGQNNVLLEITNESKIESALFDDIKTYKLVKDSCANVYKITNYNSYGIETIHYYKIKE